MTIRALLVDDHRMFADLMEVLLTREEGVEVVGAVNSGEEGVEFCRRNPPDVVLMDIDLPGIDGIEATRQVRRLAPDTQVVVITAFQGQKVITSAIEAGACGFVSKTRAAEEVVDAIKRAAAGEIVMPARDMGAVLASLEAARSAKNQVDRQLERLTPREVQILQLLAEGNSTNEIAGSLFISPFTVQGHIKSVIAKLGVRTKLEAVTLGLRHSLISLHRQYRN
jgi:DNA-binding NarL/FixJ family response regulator